MDQESGIVAVYGDRSSTSGVDISEPTPPWDQYSTVSILGNKHLHQPEYDGASEQTDVQ